MSILSKFVKALIWPLAITYLFIPSLLWLFPSILKALVFLHHAKYPFTDYSDLKGMGVVSQGRNFRFKVDGNELGVWHILPKSLNGSVNLDENNWNSFLGQPEGRPIILYHHGNSATRTKDSRVGTYNFLAMQDFHVIVFDYRGFADSTGYPSEAGVVADSMAMYRWLKDKANGNPIFFWGHSLGTAIAAASLAELSGAGECADGLILEAPFNNLAEVIRHHPMARPYRWMPDWFFDTFMLQPCIARDLKLCTDINIQRVKCPVLILHARDDNIVPFQLAKKLSTEAEKSGKDVTFIEFEHPKNYGHKWIHRAPELADILYEFVQKCLAEEKTPGRSEQHF